MRVDPVPDLDLSAGDDDDLFGLGSPRLLDDGRIVVFNAGACEIRFYSLSGEHLTPAGRCGEAPGEFGTHVSVWPWRGDSIVVSEYPMRVTVLNSDGAFGRAARVPTAGTMPLPVMQGVLADGTLVLTGLRDPDGRASSGIEAGEFTLALLRGLESTPHILGTFPGPVYEYAEFNGNLGRGPLAFSSSTEFASAAREVLVGFPDRYEIQGYEADGTLQRIIRCDFEPVRVEQRDIDWLMEGRLAEVEGEENRRAVRNAFRDLWHAEMMPAFGTPVWPGSARRGPAMIVDAEAHLWVFLHYRPGEYRNQWTVFSPDSVWLGTVVLPDRLVPSQIGIDHLIGRWTDEIGFVHVRRHRIFKPGPVSDGRWTTSARPLSCRTRGSAQRALRDGADPLEPTGKVIRGADRIVTDGPYVEAKDGVGLPRHRRVRLRASSRARRRLPHCARSKSGRWRFIRPVDSADTMPDVSIRLPLVRLGMKVGLPQYHKALGRRRCDES